MIVQSKTEEIENCREMVHRHLVGPFVSDARRRLDAACVSELLARLADGYQRLLSIEFAGLSAGDAEVILQLYDANKSQIGRIVRNMEELTRDCETVQMDSEEVQTSIILPVCIRNTCLIQCRLSTKRGLIPPRQLQVLDEYGIYTRKFCSSNLELRQRWFAQVRSVHRLFGTPWRANANTSHEETGLIYPEYFVSRSQPAEPLTVIEDRITQLKDYQKSLELNSGGFKTLVTLNAYIEPTCTPDGIELMEREIRDAYCQLTGRAAQSEKEILILKDLFFSVENIHREIASIRGLVFSTEARIFSYNQFKELRALVCYFQNYTRKRVTELESNGVQSEQHQIAPRLNDEGTRVELTIASSSAKSLVQIFDLVRFWLIESYKSLEEELTQYENKIRTQMNHLKRLELSVKTETSGQRIRSHRRSKSLCNCTGLCVGGSVRRRYSTDSLCTLKEDKRILTAGLNTLPISGFAPTDYVVSSCIHPYDFDRSLPVSPYLRCSSNLIDRNVSLIQSLETNPQLDVTNYNEICDNAASLVETFELQLARVLQMAANVLNNECTPSESANPFNLEHVSEFLKNASEVIVCSLDHSDTEIGSATPSTVLKPLVDELKIMVRGSDLTTPPRPALCSLSATSTPAVKQADSVVPLEGPSPTWETSCCFVMSKSRGFQAPGQTNCEKQLSNGVAPAANVENVDIAETSNPSSGLLGFGLNSDYVKKFENSMLEGKACGSRLRTRLLQAHESLLESLKVFEEKMEETRRCYEKIAHCTTPDSPPCPPPVLDLTNIHYLIGVRSVQELSVDWTKDDDTRKLETVQKHLTLCWKNFSDLINRWKKDTCSEVLHHSRLPMDILWDKVWTDLRNVGAKCSFELQTCLRQLSEQHDSTGSLPIQNLECSVLQVLAYLFISLELAVHHVIRYGKESNANTGSWLPDLRNFCSGLLGVHSTDADFLSSDHLKKGFGETIRDISSQVRAVQNVLMEVIGPNSGPQDKPSSVSSTRDSTEADDLQPVPANGPLACLWNSISQLLQIQSLHALPFSALTAGPSDGIEHLPRIVSAISGQLIGLSLALEGWASSYEEATRKRAIPVGPEFQQHSLSELNPVDLVSNVLQSFKQYLMLISASLRRPIYSIDDVQERLETHKIIPVDLCWQTMKVVCLCKALQKRVVEPTRHAEITKKIHYLSTTSQHVFEETIQWTIHARNLWDRYIQLSQQINKFNALIANLCARLPEYPKKLVPQLYCNPHDWLNAQTENSRRNEKLSLVTTTVLHLLHSSDSTDVLLTQLDWIRGLAVQLREQDGVAMSLISRIHRLNHDLVELYQRNGQSCEPEMRSPHDHLSSSPHDEHVTPWTGEFETGWTRLTQWTMNLFVGLFRGISIITSIERSIESLTRWFIALSLPEDAQLPRNSDLVRSIVILTKDLDKLNQLVLDLSGEEGTLLRKVHLDTLQLTEGIRISNHNGLMLDRLIDREEEMWFKYTSLRAEAERKIRLKYQEIMTLLNISPDGPLTLERQQTEKEVLNHLQKWFKDLLFCVTSVLSGSEVIFTKVGEIERYRSAWVCVNNLITNSLPLLVQLARKNNDARMTEISNTQLFKQIILRCDHLLQFSELAYFKLSTMLDTWYQIGAHLDTYATEVEQFTCQFSVPILEFGYEQLSDRDGNEYDLGIRLMQIKSTEQRRMRLIQQLFHLRNEARQLTQGKSLIGVLHGAEQMGTEIDIDADETPRAFFIPSSQSSSFLERLSFLHKSLLDTQQCSRVQGSPSLVHELADSWSQFESLETQFILECDRLSFIHECVSVFQVLPVSQTDIWFDLLSTAVGQLTGCLPDNAELFREEQQDGNCMGNRVLGEGSATYVKLQEFGKCLTDLLEKSESLGHLIEISTQLRLIRSRLMRCSTIHSDFVRRVKEVQEKLREVLDRSRNYAAFHAQNEQILRQCYTNLTEQWDTFKRELNEDLSATESDRHIASRNKMSMPLVRTLMKAQKDHISSLSDWKTSVGLLIPPVPEVTTHCVTDSAIGPHSLSLSPVITFSRFDGAWDQLVARCDEIHNLWIRCEKLSGTLRLSNNCLLVHKHARQNSGEVEDQLLHFPFESEEHSQAHLLWAELLTLKFQLPSPYSGGLVTSDPLSTAHHYEPLSLCKSAIVNSFGEFLDLLTDCIRSIGQLRRFCSNQINSSSRITLAHLFNYRFILSAADGSMNRMHDLVATVLVNGHLLLNRAIQDRIDEDDDLLKLRCLLLDVGNWSMEYHRKLWELSTAVDGVLDQWFSFVMVGTAIYNDLMEQQCHKLLSSVPMRGGEKTEMKDKYRSFPSVTQGCSIEAEQIVMLMTSGAACDEMFEVGCAMQWIQFNKSDQFICMESSERNCTDASHSSPWACALGLAKYWSHLRNSTASSISQPENELITPTVGRMNAIIQWLDALLAEKLHPSNGHLDFSDKNEMELLCKRLIDVSSLLESTEGELRGISSSSMKQACSICPALSLYTRTCALEVELLNASVRRLLWLTRSSQKLHVQRGKLQSMAQAAAFVIHLDATDLEKELRIDRARIGSTNRFQPSDTSRSVDEYDLRTMEFEIQKKITSLSEVVYPELCHLRRRCRALTDRRHFPIVSSGMTVTEVQTKRSLENSRRRIFYQTCRLSVAVRCLRALEWSLMVHRWKINRIHYLDPVLSSTNFTDGAGAMREQMILLDSLRLRATYALATAYHDLPLTRVDWSRLRKLKSEIGMHTASCTDSTEISSSSVGESYHLDSLSESVYRRQDECRSLDQKLSGSEQEIHCKTTAQTSISKLIPTSNEVALVHSTESESVNELTDEPMYSEAEAAFKENSATWNAPSFSSVSLHEIPQKQSITFDDLEVTGECNASNSTQLTSTDSGLDFNFSRGVSTNNLNTRSQFDNAEKAAPDPMVRSSTRQDKENWEIIEQLYVMRDQSDRKVKELHSQLFDGPETLAASCDHFRTFIGQLEALNFRVNSALSRWSLSSLRSNEGRKIGARDRTAQELSTVWNDTLESGGNWLRLLQEAFVNSKGLAALIAESQRHLHFAEARIRQVIDQNVRSRRAKIVKKSKEGSSDSTNTSTLNEEPPEAEEFSHVPTALRLLRVIRFRLSGWFAHTNLLLMTGESTDILSILSARKHARISESGDSALGREPSTSENDIGLRMKQLRSTIGGLIDDAERLLTEWSMRDRNTQRSSSDHFSHPLYTSSSSMSSEQAHISRLPRLKENDVLGSSDTEDNIEESVSVTSRSSMSSVSDALDDVVKEQAADVSWASESTARSLPQSDNTSCGLSMTLNTYSVHSVTSGRPCKGFIQRTGQPETGSLSNMRLYDTVTSHSLTENNIDVSSIKTLVDLPLKSSETLLNTHVSATEAPNSSPVVNFSSSTSFLQKSLRKIFLPFKKLRRGFRSRPAHLGTSAELLLSSSCKPVTTDISMDHVDSLPAPRVISAGDSEDREDTNAAVRGRSNSPIANEPTNAAHKISTGRLFRSRVLFPRCCYFIFGVLFALLLVLAFPPVFYYFFWLPRLENGGTGSGCLYSWLRTRPSEVGPGRTLLKSWPNNAPPF